MEFFINNKNRVRLCGLNSVFVCLKTNGLGRNGVLLITVTEQQ